MSGPSNDHRLSPLKLTRDRSVSRPSSRSSLHSNRTASPSIPLDDPVSVRTQMSTLKHNIRHQQAQLISLENILLRGPRPLPEFPDIMTASTPPPSSYNSTSTKVKRRSSYDVLQGIAGPDSSLPLPRRDSFAMDDSASIREGIPTSFNSSVSSSPPAYKRVASPTRTLSRIPVASVGNARALADEGHTPRHSPSTPSTSTPSTSKLSPSDPPDPSSLQPPPSPNPNRRISLTPGGTTKVLADLQTGVVNARNALENTKAQLRLSQRSVAQLTRQTEDLKEGRERLRLENEGLNNVVARKERLLQEVLERARKAESEAATLKTQLKAETATSKKSLREMESALSESTTISQKAEREYITLRDSIKGLVESWRVDTERLRDEMKRREEKWRTEAETVGKKYRVLVEEVRVAQEARGKIARLEEENKRVGKEVEEAWREEIAEMKREVEKSRLEGGQAAGTARALADELARLKRLMQAAGRPASLDGIVSSLSQLSIPEDAPS
ncbi:hypothetical protein BD779DRAFT_1511381 [Infundibulicybe gibba]|nr:hypothetical protein BD779DRAFT_1511381 [Infundibulicybe gibba]